MLINSLSKIVILALLLCSCSVLNKNKIEQYQLYTYSDSLMSVSVKLLEPELNNSENLEFTITIVNNLRVPIYINPFFRTGVAKSSINLVLGESAASIESPLTLHRINSNRTKVLNLQLSKQQLRQSLRSINDNNLPVDITMSLVIHYLHDDARKILYPDISNDEIVVVKQTGSTRTYKQYKLGIDINLGTK